MCTHFENTKSAFRPRLVIVCISICFIFIKPVEMLCQYEQHEYPIIISVSVTPPFSPNFYTYIEDQDKLSGTATNGSDSSLTLFFGGLFTNGEGISIYTNIEIPPLNIVTIMPNSTFHLQVNNIQDIFSSSQLVYQGITQEELVETQIVPDGNYYFCIMAYDAETRMPLSAEGQGCSNILTISTPGVAMITHPVCGSIQVPAMPQSVLFAWVPGENTPPNTYYTVKVNEIYPGENKNDAMASSHPAFFGTTVMMPSYVFGPADPPLVVGKSYAFAIISSEPTENVIFENNGWSEICEFTYDTILSVSGVTDTNLSWEYPLLCPISVGTRLHIEEDVTDEKKVKAKTVSDDPEQTGIPLTVEIVGGSELKECQTIGVTEVGEMPAIGGGTETECPTVVKWEDLTEQVCLCTIGDLVIETQEGKNYFKYKVKKPESFTCAGKQKDCPLCAKKYTFPVISWRLILPEGLQEVKDAEGIRHILDANGNEVGRGRSFGSEFTLFLKMECKLDIMVVAIGECCDGTKCKSQKIINIKWAPLACVCDPQLEIGPIQEYLLNDKIYVCKAELKSGCDKCKCDAEYPIEFKWELRDPKGVLITKLKQKINNSISTFTFSRSIKAGTITVSVTYKCKDKDKICKPVVCNTSEIRKFIIPDPKKKKDKQTAVKPKGIICGRIGFGGSPGTVVGVPGAVPGGAEVRVIFPGGVGGWITAEEDGSFIFSVPINWIPLSARVWYKKEDGSLSPMCIVDGPAPPSGEGKTGIIACGLIGFGSDYGRVRGLPGSVPGGAHVRVAFTGGVCGWTTANADGSFNFEVDLAWMPLSAKVWFLQEDGNLSPSCIVDGPPPPSGEGKNGEILCERIGFGQRAVTVIGLSGAVPAEAMVRISFTGGVDGWTKALEDGSFQYEVVLGWTPLSAKVCFLKADGNLSKKCVISGPIQ